MLDGDPDTAWTTGHPQTGGESVQIELTEARDVGAVRLGIGRFTGEFPRALSVECSKEGQSWESCWSGSTAALALRAVLDASQHGALIIPISAQGVRYVRLRQTSQDAISEWAITELAVFGPS